jgi:2,3-bisphosphoglycerate-dependent phosphoglycerate mutase
MKKKPLLILMRHGESMWNKANLFTGWIDIPLSQKGIEEALEAGRKIKDIPIDLIFMSTLIRSQMSAMLAMSQHTDGRAPVVLHDGEGKLGEWSQNYGASPDEMTIPVIRAWELNERMYGRLQGLNKAETAEKYGAEQVQLWRRSYDIAPPEGESLQMTAARSIPYFQEKILPQIQQGKNVFVAAHGNSLRSIVMFLEGLSKEQVLKLELDTGKPLIYNFRDEVFTREPLS